MAILLKRNAKASTVAMIVCRPRKGEKAMKTPIEKASAVRSGGSSIASRRRTVARNIDQFQVPGSKFQVKGCVSTWNLELGSWNLFIASERVRFVVVNVEDGQELGDAQEVLQLLRQVEEFQLPALFINRR